MIEPTTADMAIARLDAWLETIRAKSCTIGYGGPVAHWWQQSLLYTGPGFDWRYEGIILGYLELWQRTSEDRWLAKARRAGDDLISIQMEDGNYPASAFENNPSTGGTPHEAAICLGLLELASELKKIGIDEWERYYLSAEKNLKEYYLKKLWDPETQSFRDHPISATFVPNKAATASQAMFALARITGEERWIEQYAMPNLKRVLYNQVKEPGFLQGAIAQNSFGDRIVQKYMPFYIARCVPGLIEGYKWSDNGCYLGAALLAVEFIWNKCRKHPGFLPAIYPNGQVNYWPQWVAALGDILNAVELLRPYGFEADLEDLQRQLLDGQDATGGIQTAHGFAAQAGGQPGQRPDFRDLLHVAGWCDKAFHYLSRQISGNPLPPAECQPNQSNCTFLNSDFTFYEDKERLQVSQKRKTVYLWVKGESWVREASPEFWLH